MRIGINSLRKKASMTEPVFFARARAFSAGEVAAATGAQLLDPGLADVLVERVSALPDGGPGALVYSEGSKNAPLLAACRASAVICEAKWAGEVDPETAVLVSERPQRAFVAAVRLFYPTSMRPLPITGETGISPAAHVDPSAALEPGAVVEPGAVIGAGAAIGAGTRIGPNAVIGAGCQIGRECDIGPNVTIQHALVGDHVVVHPGARIGQDGFGYLPGPAGLEKIPQIGRVVIQNSVEIGANTTIDRGAMADTVIGEGTKIDNLVQVAHNVHIGRFCVLAGMAGIAGSVKLGDGVMIGGGVGIADHLTIGAGVQLAAGSGVMKDIPPRQVWAGYPAQPMSDQMREVAILRNLARARTKRGKKDD